MPQFRYPKPTFNNYNNEAFDASGDQPKPILNGFPIGIVKAKTAVKKWGTYSRSKREFEGIIYPPVLDENQEEIYNKAPYQEDHGKQKKLNYKLLKHFVELANPEEVNEEVDFELIESLLNQGADVNCTDKYGQTLLHEASRTWHTDVSRFLLGHGADINKTDNYGRTALHIAAATNYPEMVELLVQKGANLEAQTRTELQTPLHFAARNDATDSLRAMIKLGAEKECRDYRKRTPLFVAAELDRSDTARFLVDVNADATVIDDAGQSCMTHMITNMGPVARQALDQFHRKDRANRKQYFYLNLLEPKMMQPKKKYQKGVVGEEGRYSSLAKTPLEVIVNYKQLDLIMHPVITRLIDVKWKQFGRRRAWIALIVNLLFVLVWTILGVAVPWQTRRVYTFPQDWWRITLLLIGCAFTIYFIAYEVIEIVRSRDNFQTWKAWREDQIKRDLDYCHPKWPEEKKYLDREIECLDDLLPNYFRDFWNYFDWTVYSLIVIVVITHAIDTGVFVASPCCLNDVCTNSSVLICDGGGYVNNLSLSVWNNRIFVALIICLWLRLMKNTRAFRFLGPFIVMLGKIAWDVVRFFYLYMEFYIPYSCAFWMIFGNLSTIQSMSTVDRMLFSLYRITLVDDYQFDEMQAYDIVMAYILVGTFLGVSAVLCINLFIALLSDTFQRVYDNANANAVMQQATLMLGHEENLSNHTRKQVRKFIEMEGSPEEAYYDDDLTVAQDADLKKVTIQIKEQMDELMEHIQQAETDNRLSGMRESVSSLDDEAQLISGDPDSSGRRSSLLSIPGKRGTRRTSIGDKADDGFTTPRSGRPTMKKTLSDVMALNKSNSTGNIVALPQQSSDLLGAFQRRMGDTQSMIRELKVSIAAQEQTQKRMRNDMKEIKQMLWKLAKEKAIGGVAAMVEEEQQRAGAVPGRHDDPSQSTDPSERARFLSRFVSPVATEGNRPSSSSGLPAVEMVPLPGAMPRGQSSSNISQPITVDVTVHGGNPERQNTSDA